MCVHRLIVTVKTDSWCDKGPEHKPQDVSKPTKRVKAKPVFTRKENATLAQRIEILDWYHKNGKNQTKAAHHFDPKYPNLRLKQPTISAWVNDELKWREQWARCNGSERLQMAKRPCQTEHPEITEMLELWVTKAMESNLQVTGEVLRQEWIRFADMAGVPEDGRLKLSEGWLGCFKMRTGLKQYKRHGEAASASADMVKKDRDRIRTLLKEGGYTAKNIFNMDETGLFYAYVHQACQFPQFNNC